MSDIIILNSGDSAVLDPIQSGFAHGYGIFETIKLSAGRLFLWQAHWQRLADSAATLRLPLNHSAQQVLSAIRDLVQVDGLRDGVVKVSLMAAGDHAQCYVYSRSAVVPSEAGRLLFVADSPLNEHALLAGHKTHNYMENMLLLKSARSAGCSDVIRVNTAGQLAETAVGNLFFIQDETLFTPSLTAGGLPGVVRSVVLEAAQILGVPVVEGAFVPNVLQLIDAAFVTNSLVGIQAVDTVVVDAMERSVESAKHPMVVDLKEALGAVEAGSAIDIG